MDIIPNHCSSISKRIYSKSNTGRNILFLLSSFFYFYERLSEWLWYHSNTRQNPWSKRNREALSREIASLNIHNALKFDCYPDDCGGETPATYHSS